MSLHLSLFESENICLGPIDFDKDPAIESRWTQDLSYLNAISWRAAYPQSAAEIKKSREKLEKEIEESRNQFYFTIRRREDRRLVGFVHLSGIEWSHGAGSLQMAIGDPAERGQGYGSEALRLALRYSFHELNLYRLSALVGGDNPRAVAFFQRFGFIEEVRRRQALLRAGRSWDILLLGLLRSDWHP